MFSPLKNAFGSLGHRIIDGLWRLGSAMRFSFIFCCIRVKVFGAFI